jgi:glycosyltransferase involved in cell wall biosynthesis
VTARVSVAWFSPLPPVRSGISQYSQELLPRLAESHRIDVFVDGAPHRFSGFEDGVQVFDAYDFIWKHRQRPYDLIVYQLGNARCHDYLWAYLVRYPGLVVLHDGQLQHARARYLLQQKKFDDYRLEFQFNHPDAHPDIAELGIEGLLGKLTYFWPMLRVVLDSARHVVVHNQWLADRLRESYPETSLSVIEMGVRESTPHPDARAVIRARYGIPPEAPLFLSLGTVTPEKRIHETIVALGSIRTAVPNVHLLLAGDRVSHYDPREDARLLGFEDRVSIAGFVRDDELDDYLAAADVCLCMRWPTSRETSASWLRCLAGGKATVTSDLAHLIDIPTLDGRDRSPLSAGDPVSLTVDILDEKHALSLALRTLAEDGTLREMLARNARELWYRRFRLDRMVDDYRSAFEAIGAETAASHNRTALPAHLLATGTEHAARVLREAGFPGSPTAALWTHPGE